LIYEFLWELTKWRKYHLIEVTSACLVQNLLEFQIIQSVLKQPNVLYSVFTIYSEEKNGKNTVNRDTPANYHQACIQVHRCWFLVSEIQVHHPVSSLQHYPNPSITPKASYCRKLLFIMEMPCRSTNTVKTLLCRILLRCHQIQSFVWSIVTQRHQS